MSSVTKNSHDLKLISLHINAINISQDQADDLSRDRVARRQEGHWGRAPRDDIFCIEPVASSTGIISITKIPSWHISPPGRQQVR